MAIKIQLWGQLKNLANTEFVEVDAKSIDNAILEIADKYTELKQLLLTDGKPSQSILVFVNEDQHMWGTDKKIDSTDSITVMSPIAGG